MAVSPWTEDDALSERNQGHSLIARDIDSPLKVESQADDKSLDSESEGRNDQRTNGHEEEDPTDENSEDEFSDDDDIEENDDIGEDDDVEGTCIDREGGSYDPVEFSEPPGPATLRGKP